MPRHTVRAGNRQPPGRTATHGLEIGPPYRTAGQRRHRRAVRRPGRAGSRSRTRHRPPRIRRPRARRARSPVRRSCRRCRVRAAGGPPAGCDWGSRPPNAWTRAGRTRGPRTQSRSRSGAPPVPVPRRFPSTKRRSPRRRPMISVGHCPRQAAPSPLAVGRTSARPGGPHCGRRGSDDRSADRGRSTRAAAQRSLTGSCAKGPARTPAAKRAGDRRRRWAPWADRALDVTLRSSSRGMRKMSFASRFMLRRCRLLGPGGRERDPSLLPAWLDSVWRVGPCPTRRRRAGRLEPMRAGRAAGCRPPGKQGLGMRDRASPPAEAQGSLRAKARDLPLAGAVEAFDQGSTGRTRAVRTSPRLAPFVAEGGAGPCLRQHGARRWAPRPTPPTRAVERGRCPDRSSLRPGPKGPFARRRKRAQ